MSRTLLQDLNILELASKIPLIEKLAEDGKISGDALRAFELVIYLGREVNSSGVQSFFTGGVSKARIAVLIQGVEDAWRARFGDNGQV